MAQARGVELGMAFLDGISIRAHQKAAGAAVKTPLRRGRVLVKCLAALVPADGTVDCVIADSTGRAVAFALAPGQAHDLLHAVPPLARLPGVPVWLAADRGYSNHAFRQHVWDLGARPAVPTRRDETPVACRAPIYNNRNRVERL